MAQEKSSREQAIGVVDEYLAAAALCITEVKPDGSILGYPAALLLLCATDAIGQGVPPHKPGAFTRLDVLANSLFGPALTDSQATQVRDWYRHKLVHTGTMAVGVELEPDASGPPFEFDATGAPVLIRVGKLYEIVNAAWARVDRATFNPPSPKGTGPNPADRMPSSRTPAASGVV